MNDTNRDDAVTRALRRLKEDDATMGASPAVESRLLQEVRGLRPSRRRRPGLFAGLAAAAVVLAAIGLTVWSQSRSTQMSPEGRQVVYVALEATTEFFPLFYSSVPAARTTLVRLELPRASLARFGLFPADVLERTSGSVLADVLIGEDGLARAIRFVRKLSQEPRS